MIHRTAADAPSDPIGQHRQHGEQFNVMTNVVRLWDRFWFSESSLLRLAAFRIVILLVAAWELKRYLPIYLLEGRGRPAAPYLYREYQPLYVLELLGIQSPSSVVAYAVVGILSASIFLAVVGFRTRIFLALSTILSLYLYAIMYSFGQGHHDKVGLAFALLVLPLSPAGCRLSIDRLMGRVCDATQRQFAGWAIQFVQVCMALGYSAAGITKVVKAGSSWMNGYSLQATFLGGGAMFSDLAANSHAFAIAMSLGVVLLQITFPLCLFVRRLCWIYIPSIVAFHFGNWLIVGTGNQIGMWCVVLAAFIPLDRVLNYFFGMTDD